jgi:hypothetical protein
MYVDLPPMFGPVRITSRPLSANIQRQIGSNVAQMQKLTF